MPVVQQPGEMAEQTLTITSAEQHEADDAELHQHLDVGVVEVEAAARADIEFLPEPLGLGKALHPVCLVADADDRRLGCRLQAGRPEIGAAGQRRILAEGAEQQVQRAEVQPDEDDCDGEHRSGQQADFADARRKQENDAEADDGGQRHGRRDDRRGRLRGDQRISGQPAASDGEHPPQRRVRAE